MNKELINKIAKQAIANIEHKQNDKHDTRWWSPELYDQEFAKLLLEEVEEVIENVNWGARFNPHSDEYIQAITDKFGVKIREYI